MMDNYIYINQLLSNKMIIKFDMFDLSMENRIGSQRDNTEIITSKRRGGDR